MQAITCLRRAHAQWRLTKPILPSLISWWLSSVRESSSWRSLRRRWGQDCAAGSQERVGVGGEGGGESKSVSFGSLQLSCRSVLLSIAGCYRLQRCWVAENPLYRSTVCRAQTVIWVFVWGGRNSGERLWVRDYFSSVWSTATSFTGLYLKFHTKSSYVAVCSLIKIIAVPCSALRHKSPMPCTSEGTDVEPVTKTETARGSLPSACWQRLSQIKSLRPLGLAEIAS